MRDFRVCLEIDIFAIEHHPFSIRRRHRRADAFELHHVFEGEWMFATGDTGPWCLREKRTCERETECDKNFHLAVKLPPNSRTCKGQGTTSFWGAQAASLFISAACRDATHIVQQSIVCMLPASCRQLQAGSLCSPEVH